MSKDSAKAHSHPRPLVSVLIPSYNQAGFIAEAIESALGQDYPNLQIVVTDDASTDGSREIVSNLQEQHPNKVIAVFNAENRGVTPNCNAGLRHCTGQYLALLGGDDVFLPGKISRQVEWFEEDRDRVLCGHQVEIFYDDGTRSHPFPRRLREGRGPGPLIRYGAFSTCSIMVRADRIPPYGFDEAVPLVSDFKLFVDVLSGGGEFGYIPGIHARYRRHRGNVSADLLAMADGAAEALSRIEDQYPQYAEECRRAAARLIDFQMGRYRLAQGDRKAARRDFLNAIKVEPGFLRSWLELAKTLVPA